MVTRLRRSSAGAPGLFQPLRHIGSRSFPGRDGAEQEAGGQRNHKREGEDRRIQLGRGEVGPSRQSAEQELEPEVSQEYSHDTAQKAQQHTFGEKLADQPRAARAQRQADRQFLLARRRPRQQQVGHVRARDQQHDSHHNGERDSGEQQRRGTAAGAGQEDVAQRLHGCGMAGIGGRIISGQTR